MSRKNSERGARAKAQKALASGEVSARDNRKVTARDVRNLESAHKQTRRDNAKYEKRHVHVGGDPTLDSRGESTTREQPKAPAENKLSPEQRKAVRTARNAAKGTAVVPAVAPNLAHERADTLETQKAGAAVALKESEAKRAKTLDTTTEELGDGRVRDNLADAENVASSAVESRGGVGQSAVGPRFRQTERAAQGRLSRAEGRRARVETLAWVDYERDRPADAKAIEEVWERASQEALLLRGSRPTEAFAVAAASYIKWKRTSVGGRATLKAELATAWQGWIDYRDSWDRGHPTLPALPWSSIKHASSAEVADRWATQPERMSKQRKDV